jgi:hypothetical protein
MYSVFDDLELVEKLATSSRTPHRETMKQNGREIQSMEMIEHPNSM